MAETGTKVILAVAGIEQQPTTLTATTLLALVDADSFDATFLASALATDSFTSAIWVDAFTAGIFDEATMLDAFGANSWSNENLVVAMEDTAAEALGAIRRANVDGAVAASTWIATDLIDDVAFLYLFETDSLTTTVADKVIQIGALGEDLLTAEEVDHRATRIGVIHTAGVANMSTLAASRFTIPWQMQIELADAAATTYSFDNIPFGVYITECNVYNNGVNSAGDTIGVTTDVDGATGQVALFTAENLGAAAWDYASLRTAWNETQALLAAGADIDVIIAGAAGNRGCTLIIKGLRAAD